MHKWNTRLKWRQIFKSYSINTFQILYSSVQKLSNISSHKYKWVWLYPSVSSSKTFSITMKLKDLNTFSSLLLFGVLEVALEKKMAKTLEKNSQIGGKVNIKLLDSQVKVLSLITMLILKTRLLKIGVKCLHLISLVQLILQRVFHHTQFQQLIRFHSHSWWDKWFR